MRTVRVLGLMLVLAALAAACLAAKAKKATPDMRPGKVGTIVRGIVLPDLDGKPVKLDGFQAKARVVQVFSPG